MDWNSLFRSRISVLNCHSLRGSVDWNTGTAPWSEEGAASLPTRECGLKSTIVVTAVSITPSLPTRECGLKYISFRTFGGTESHSLRGSVDWNTHIYGSRAVTWVTPYAGVWIEICWFLLMILCLLVTPYAGVWIEIFHSLFLIINYKSLPTRECGLKLLLCPCRRVRHCHSLRGSVDWNRAGMKNGAEDIGHSLRGSVDWNRRI